MATNKYDLDRNIPESLKREIRKRSKWGCVICREGLFEYEHIDPSFEEATEHNPELMCCLCHGCHAKVTRGHISKQRVKQAYAYVQNNDVPPPKGILDFHNGNAELQLGDIVYTPSVRTILRYYGQDLIRVDPGINDEPGRISAIFTDSTGTPILNLVENSWEGSLDLWDINIQGSRIIVRRKKGEIALQLKLIPPGKIVVERLDMRINDIHLLATDKAYTVGLYMPDHDNELLWFRTKFMLMGGNPDGAAIEIVEPDKLEARYSYYRNNSVELKTSDELWIANGKIGVMVKPLGIVFASQCGAFGLIEYAHGLHKLSETRKSLIESP